MPSFRPEGFIEINRTFSDFQESADEEATAFDSYFTGHFHQGTTWDSLLASQCSVVLAEAGSGKTWELQNRAETLREDGRLAFFIPLERLAQNSLEDCLGHEDKSHFESWQNSSDEGLFFLDAVEEAKLATRHAFEKALQSFFDGIGVKGLKRVRMVVASRISGWRSRDDGAMLRKFLDPGETPKKRTTKRRTKKVLATLLQRIDSASSQ
jgi:hypothetical protein